MSEKLNLDNGQFEHLLQSPEHKALPTAEQAEPLRPGEPDPTNRLAHRLEEARTTIDQTAESGNPLERLQAAENTAEPASKLPINQELKSITLRRELQQIRRKLPAPQRALSRVVHQPVVRAVSEGAAKSVSRPSGLLGGGITAFIGTSGYLYLAKHIGFRYNYLVFLMLFVAGFALGLIIELAVHMATASRRHSD